MLIGTRGTINVSTIAVIHCFSKWASYWHLWLIPNILKWQDCKIFTELVPLQTPSRNSHWKYSVKKVFLKICKISLETLSKRACNFIKKRLQHRCFPEFEKFVRTPILKNICEGLLLPFLGFTKLNHNAFF